MPNTPHSYPRQRRIRKRKDYVVCYEYGRKYHCAHFLLFALPRKDMPARFGIAISRKVGNAVVRNRLKRILREFFRLQTIVLSGLELVAVAKKDAAGLGYWDVCAELEPLLAQASKNARNGP